jgi:hypothetical protein
VFLFSLLIVRVLRLTVNKIKEGEY